MNKIKFRNVILILMMLTLIGCDNEPSGPSKSTSSSNINEVSSSSESKQSSNTDISSSSHVSEVKLLTIENSIYTNDVFVNFADSKQSNVATGSWDIKIDAKGIKLNTAKTAGAIIVEKTFAEVSEADISTDAEWGGTIVGESLVFETGKVYIIQFPGVFDHATQMNGPATFVKVELFYDHTTHVVSIQHANLDGTENIKVEAYGYYSFNQNATVKVEPESWDLMFGAYRTLLESGTEYSVKGALIASGCEVAIDSVNSFVDIVSAKSYEFSNEVASIGHTWKTYADKIYTMTENRIYIVKTGEKYYKVKFLNFYNSSNETGFPQFQYQEIGN